MSLSWLKLEPGREPYHDLTRHRPFPPRPCRDRPTMPCQFGDFKMLKQQSRLSTLAGPSRGTIRAGSSLRTHGALWAYAALAPALPVDRLGYLQRQSGGALRKDDKICAGETSAGYD